MTVGLIVAQCTFRQCDFRTKRFRFQSKHDFLKSHIKRMSRNELDRKRNFICEFKQFLKKRFVLFRWLP